jgi:hypothetical protein
VHRMQTMACGIAVEADVPPNAARGHASNAKISSTRGLLRSLTGRLG